jgi:MFS family permease
VRSDPSALPRSRVAKLIAPWLLNARVATASGTPGRKTGSAASFESRRWGVCSDEIPMSRSQTPGHGVSKLLGAGSRRTQRRVIETVGGAARARVIVLLASVLALSSADTSAVGADAGPLKHALHINFLEVGLLVALPSLAGSIATLPVGVLTDRVRRVSLLKWSVVVWSLAMVVAGASTSFAMLLASRLVLGAAIATTGPTLASLTGDFFPARERGKIYGFILTGDLIGSVIGLFFSGNVAAISWRLAFWVLVVPSAILAWAIKRFLWEPARGRTSRLEPWSTETHDTDPSAGGRSNRSPGGPAADLERAVHDSGVTARAENVVGPQSSRMNLSAAVYYVLRVPTNVALIIASSLGYFFISGVLTFGVVFIRHQYSVGQTAATSLLGVVAVAAVVGVLVSGRLADALVHRGHAAGRVIITASCFLAACLLFLPALLSRSLVFSLPFLWLAGAALYGSNPPLDAARLDIMPSWLWGRAEGVRTLLRSLTTAAAPLLFGFISDLLGGSGRATHASGQTANAAGLGFAFLIMLIPLAAAGAVLLWARRDYPRDVATAIASEALISRSSK